MKDSDNFRWVTQKTLHARMLRLRKTLSCERNAHSRPYNAHALLALQKNPRQFLY